MKRLLLTLSFAITCLISAGQLPITFDLRDYNGHNYVTSVKVQQGGTCWTHGSMAAAEGNLMMTGSWAAAGDTGEPNLAEYHLDWWNGFNNFNNDDMDPPSGQSGVTVHLGGDYLIVSAYMSRGEGAVREVDGQSYDTPPPRDSSSFHHYFAREINWLNAGDNLENITAIKNSLMMNGVMGTCMYSNSSFMNPGFIHYQPVSDWNPPNHSIAIIGWNDTLTTPAPHPGAWLCKNSWGTAWGLGGFFWISYYDKHCGHHPEMGAVVFRNVGLMPYEDVYYWDYHGWRDTKTDCQEAFNAFTARRNEFLKGAGFYTAAEVVNYQVIVYDSLANGELHHVLGSMSGTTWEKGFHALDFSPSIPLTAGRNFYLYLNLSNGGQPFDRSSEVSTLLGSGAKPTVNSVSHPGESYYKEGNQWKDLFDYQVPNWGSGNANFCIKAYTGQTPAGSNNHPGTLRPKLYQNQPNPGSDGTSIRFTLERSGTVELSIYDIFGRKIRTLAEGNMAEGSHSVWWDGKDDHGAEAAPGNYIYILRAGTYSEAKKLLLIK